MVKRKRESISSLRGKNYDLFIDVDPLDKSKKAVLARETIGKEAERLGYSGCAFVHRVKGRLGANDENPNGPGVVDSVEEQPGFKQYSRLHLILSDPSQGHNLNMNNQVVRSFDILSVEPKSEKVFTQCCQNLEVDIITINCEDRLPYRLSRSMVKLAIERGISFELCFREPLTDSSTRRFFVSNGVALQRVTKGKSILISSAATDRIELRSPLDAVRTNTSLTLSVTLWSRSTSHTLHQCSLGTLFDLDMATSRETVRRAAEVVLLNAEKRGVYGSVRVLPLL